MVAHRLPHLFFKMTFSPRFGRPCGAGCMTYELTAGREPFARVDGVNTGDPRPPGKAASDHPKISCC